MRYFFSTVFFISMAGILLLVNCAEKSDEAPFQFSIPGIQVITTLHTQFDTLVFEDNQLEVEPDDQLSFDVTITADGGFSSYSIFLSLDGALDDTLIVVKSNDLDAVSGITSIQDSKSFEISSDLVNKSVRLTFLVTDQLGQVGETFVDLEVYSPRARVYSTVLLAAPLEDLTGDSFFNSAKGTVHSPQAILAGEALASEIDFGYYFGLEDGATIASPKGFEKTTFSGQVEGWTAVNATTIRSTTQTSLIEIERFEDIDNVYAEGTDESGILSDLSVGDIIAFETVKGKRGLVRINTIVDGDNDSYYNGFADYIELDVIVQERTPRD